jgi:hypothetical protein
LDKVHLAQEGDFHESDISDDDVADGNPPSDNLSESEIIVRLKDDLRKQEEYHQRCLKDKENELSEQKKIADDRMQKIKEENESLKQQLEIERFGVARFGTDDAMIRFYTSFVSYAAFLAFFNYVQPNARNMQRHYYQAMDDVSGKYGRPSCMKLIDELFMFLCRLRLGLPETDLANRFNCSVATVKTEDHNMVQSVVCNASQL